MAAAKSRVRANPCMQATALDNPPIIRDENKTIEIKLIVLIQLRSPLAGQRQTIKHGEIL